VPGTSLFEVADSIDRDRAGRQLARFLTALHHPAARRRAEAVVGNELRLVVDFETIGAAEPEYDLRAFPGPGMGPGLELLAAIMRHYQQISGRRLSTERLMAWHFRNALGDVLWRSEAGIPLADHRTPPEWVDDLTARFSTLGIDPGAPFPGGRLRNSTR